MPGKQKPRAPHSENWISDGTSGTSAKLALRPSRDCAFGRASMGSRLREGLRRIHLRDCQADAEAAGPTVPPRIDGRCFDPPGIQVLMIVCANACAHESNAREREKQAATAFGLRKQRDPPEAGMVPTAGILRALLLGSRWAGPLQMPGEM